MIDSHRYLGEGCDPCKEDSSETVPHDYEDPYCIWHDEVYGEDN